MIATFRERHALLVPHFEAYAARSDGKHLSRKAVCEFAKSHLRRICEFVRPFASSQKAT